MNTNNVTPNAKKSRLPLILAMVLIIVAAGAGFLWYWNSPAEIAVHTLPDCTVFDYGSTLNTDGMIVEITYNSGKTEQITEGFTCSPMQLLEAGDVDITVTYEDMTASYSVQSIPVLTGIRVAHMPDENRYLIGSELNLTGLVVEADYNDGSVQTITEGFECAPMNLTTLGTQPVTVTYEGKEDRFDVNVVEVSALSLRTLGGRSVYMVGEAVDPTGYALNVTYSDGITETIRNGFTCSDDIFTEPGTQTASVFYQGKEGSFDVEVLPAVTFDDVSLMLTSVSYGDGSGRNENGAMVYWTILCDFNLDALTRENFMPTITSSWAHVTNGGTWEKECSWESAKDGETYAEFGIWMAENSYNGKERFSMMLYLPDDESIEGEQSITIHVGCCELTVNFTLTYSGNYDNGTGWRISNVTY